MVARAKDVLKKGRAVTRLLPTGRLPAPSTLSEKRNASPELSPNGEMPSVSRLSKAKRAKSSMVSIEPLPALPPSQGRAGHKFPTSDQTRISGADPSISLPAGHPNYDSLLRGARREAPISADAGHLPRGTLAACAGIRPRSRRKGLNLGDDQRQNADASPLSRTEGHLTHADLGSYADGSALSESRAMHHVSPMAALPGSPPSDDERATPALTPRIFAPAPSSSILVIRELARQRTDLLRAWQRLNNQIKAIERRGQPGGDTLELRAAPSIAVSAAPALVHCVETTMAARKAVEKQLEKLAKSLPVYATFTKPTKGLGAGGLALIIGETGDLSQYANPAKVWKRMGLAVINGERQRRVAGNADAALLHGYSSHRRQIMWNIGDSMVKVGDTYRQVYLDRKEYEKAKDPDATPMHHHRRAQRYMEKRILRDLWRAWRDLHGVAA